MASDYAGIDLSGNSFYVKSSNGSVEIQNSRDKFIGYSAGGQMAVYSYVASGGGNVDGGNLQVQGGSGVRYQVAEGTFAVNQYTGEWSNR